MSVFIPSPMFSCCCSPSVSSNSRTSCFQYREAEFVYVGYSPNFSNLFIYFKLKKYIMNIIIAKLKTSL